jgi:glutathione S-transferase
VTDLILHHYEMSPFSEKVRRILAWKRLPWRAVRAPAVMPKPDLVALTGGYRRIPVLQVERHVYCDTALIARVLDQLAPAVPLFPTPASESAAEWADTRLFEVAAVVGMRPTRFEDSLKWLTNDELSKIVPDRKAMRTDARVKPLSVEAARSHLFVYLSRLDAQVASSPFLMGPEPTGADFAAYTSAWFLERLAPEPLEPFEGLRRWMGRIAEPVTEPVETIAADDALRIAANHASDYSPSTPFDTRPGLTKGARVVVRAADYARDPVEGELVHLEPNHVVLKREDPRAGTVLVHFPMVGYELAPATEAVAAS